MATKQLTDLKNKDAELRDKHFGAKATVKRLIGAETPEDEAEQARDFKELGRMKDDYHASQKAVTENQKLYGMKKGGKVRTASQRADGCAIRGKTRA